MLNGQVEISISKPTEIELSDQSCDRNHSRSVLPNIQLDRYQQQVSGENSGWQDELSRQLFPGFPQEKKSAASRDR